MFATAGGRLYGGDSGSSFVGHFTEADGVISAECMMSRHYHDPGYVPMFDVDNIALNYTGVRCGEEIHFEGGSPALPGVRFTTVLTPINDADAPPPGTVGADGIGNGLYSIHIRMLDGIDAGNTGVMLLHDGTHQGWRRILRLHRGLHGGERQMEGRTRQPRAYAGQGRPAAVRRP